MIRILLAGDLHIGCEYQKTRESNATVAQRYWQSRLDSLKKIIQYTNDNKYSYIIISDDINDKKGIPEKLQKVVRDIHAESICPVVVLPGNHDYYEGSGENFAGFNKKFDKYIGMIALNDINVDSTDRLSLNSHRNKLNKRELLSEGSKKAVLIAFSLALLEFFSPMGYGPIFLDDNLFDLDTGRRQQAVNHLSEFTKENQVIITTCDPNIAKIVGWKPYKSLILKFKNSFL